MTACSADSVIIGVRARVTTAQKRPPEEAHSHVRMRLLHDPDQHPP